MESAGTIGFRSAAIQTCRNIVPSKRKKSKPGTAGVLQFDQSKEVRAIARERVGAVKPGQVILPKDLRRKPKHKQEMEMDDTAY